MITDFKPGYVLVPHNRDPGAPHAAVPSDADYSYSDVLEQADYYADLWQVTYEVWQYPAAPGEYNALLRAIIEPDRSLVNVRNVVESN